jgi:hypothetical protein
VIEHAHPAADQLPATDVAGRSARVFDLLAREAPLLITCSCIAALWLGYLGVQIAADTWLNLLGGQLILAHGFPHHDALAVLSHGRDWVDQQWLANLFFYGLYKAGGVSLVARVNVLVFVGAIALAFIVARKRGGSIPSVMLCCIPMCLVSLDFARAQVLVQPLLVALLALLGSESRRPTRRFLLAFPLLAVWANLHGSVVIASALVALLGAVELRRHWHRPASSVRCLVRPLLLICLPWFCIFASPYGFSLRTYYSATVGNPEFGRHLTEWTPPTFPSLWGVPFFVLAALSLVLVARQPRALTTFEICALGLTLLSGLMAVRSIPWFAICAAIWVPPLLDQELGKRRSAKTSTVIPRPLALAGVAVGLAIAGSSLLRGNPPPAADWPAPAAAQVRHVLTTQPSARIFASYDLADWLLFTVSEARGRVAFDGRWEVLDKDRFAAVIHFFGQQSPQWESITAGFRFLVLNPTNQRGLVDTYTSRPNVKVLFRSPRVIVLDRGPAADRSPRSG